MAERYRIVDDNHLHSMYSSLKLARAVLSELAIHSPEIDFYIERFDVRSDSYVKV